MKNLLFRWLFFVFFISFSCYAGPNSVVETKLQRLLDDFRDKSNAPAAVLSVNFSANKISTFVSGTIEKPTLKNPNPSPVTPNNLFQIGSITKSFTAAIILQLEAEKKLSINDTILDITKKYGSWLPTKEYEAWKNISIKELLNMTSGIFDVTEDKKFMDILAKQPEKQWSPEEIIHYAYKNKPYFLPGKGWHYSNGAYNILGMLIEKVTHDSFEKEINQRLIKKHALDNTYYLPYPYPQNILNRMAHGYAYMDGGFSPPIKSGEDMTRANLSAAGPSGALVANSSDITRWVRLLFTGKVLAPPQLNEMLTAVCTGADSSCKPGNIITANSHSQGFSLGLVQMYDPSLGLLWVYIGSTPGYYSAFMWMPKKQIALALTVSATTNKSKKLLKTLAEAAKIVINN